MNHAAGLSLMPRKVPEPRLAYTNRVYASQDDFAELWRPLCEGPHYVEINNVVFSLERHADVATGSIALSEMQRKFARVGLFQAILVKPFSPPVPFELGVCLFEVGVLPGGASGRSASLTADGLQDLLRDMFKEQVLAPGQVLALSYDDLTLKATVVDVKPLDLGTGTIESRTCTRGILGAHTQLRLQTAPVAAGQCELEIVGSITEPVTIFNPDFNFEALGIGGLKKQFADIFRRAFATRCLPPRLVREMGIEPVRGMLLYGPSGTGKTLIARQLAKFLKAAEPKIVNGPEILNKYVGQAEENVRNLFADAEREQSMRGDKSQLHVIILDEMDAICKHRGSSSTSGVSDNVVNQFLAKIDGVNSLNNVLLIGMTNRRDMIDVALLRPGRLELQVEISLPDEAGREEILNIHTAKMRENGYLDADISMRAIAERTKNYSGAELAGVVRAASAHAVSRKVDVRDPTKMQDGADGLDGISVTLTDIEQGLLEVRPAFGFDSERLDNCIEHGIISFSEQFEDVLRKCSGLVRQVHNSTETPLLTLLLAGEEGSGKTALSAHLALHSCFPFVRRITNEAYVGDPDHVKVAKIAQVFEDAGKSPLSLIILDDLERLLNHVCIGPRFSNDVLQTLITLLKKRPAKADHRMIVIGTTSDMDFIRQTKLVRAFNVALSLPVLHSAEHFRAALISSTHLLAPQVLPELCAALDGHRVGIRTFLQVIEMAAQREHPIQKHIFLDCLQDATAMEDDPFTMV
jgi:vesicle-fusing ATPase